jgi:hypothetical protein
MQGSTHQLILKVMISKGLEKGPMQTMNRMIDFAPHVFGATKYSGSTLSLTYTVRRQIFDQM